MVLSLPIVNYPSIKTLDEKSIRDICNGSEEAMIYGFGHCGYGPLCIKLNEIKSLKKILDCTVGNHLHEFKTLEGRKIEQIEIPLPNKDESQEYVSYCKRMCKAGITNLILENYKRYNKGLSLIPIIFSIDSDEFTADPRYITTRQIPFNQYLTNQELRRAFKLCFDVDDENLRLIAKKTFKFIKLVSLKEGHYKFENTTPIWERKAWESSWKERKDTSKQFKKNDKFDWRKQLITRKNIFDAMLNAKH